MREVNVAAGKKTDIVSEDVFTMLGDWLANNGLLESSVYTIR